MSVVSAQCVYVIDDDEAIRDSVAFLLSTVGIACKTYPSANAFLDQYDGDGVCCIVVDIRMPGLSGLEFQQELIRRQYPASLIFITGHGEIDLAVQAMRLGAIDFIQKPFKDQALLDSVQAALQQVHGQRRNTERVQDGMQCFHALTPREQQVLHRVVSGQANKVIAYDLGVSQRTIEIHRARVMHKMHVKNLAELVRMYMQLNLASEANS